MWRRLWAALVVVVAFGQQAPETNQGARFEWGWQLQSPPGNDPATTGQYYVKLPQAEHQVSYSADGSGYHSAVGIQTNGDHHHHAATFALGQQALDLLRSQGAQRIQQLFSQDLNTTMLHPTNFVTGNTNSQPQVDIFLLQQQFSSPPNEEQQQLIQILPSNSQDPSASYQQIQNYYNSNNPSRTQGNYIIEHVHYPTNQITTNSQNSQEATNEQRINEESSQLLSSKEVTSEQQESQAQPLIQVFKDHNCTNDETDDNLKANMSQETQSTKLFAEVPSYEQRRANINGDFGTKITERPLTYKGAVHFSVEQPKERYNARSERVLLSYESTTSATTFSEQTESSDGISKLVASTQDLITNEDLLNINHAAEKYGYLHNDDIIKPRARFSLRQEQSTRHNYVTPSPKNNAGITVKAKLGNIVDSKIEHLEDNQDKENILQTNSNDYRFSSPIIVQDSTVTDFKEQVVNNIVSTVSPYLEEGYEVASIRNTVDSSNLMEAQNARHTYYNEDLMDSRPVSQKYLAPITVALRLLNANDSKLFNTVDEYEGSDSEVVTDRVTPSNDKTVVEVQKSIPLAITHINEVEVHKAYLEDGRSNENIGNMAKALLNKYVEDLHASSEIQKTMNENLYKFGAIKDIHTTDSEENNDFRDSSDNLQQSENIQTEIEIRPNDGEHANNERNEYIRYHSDTTNYRNKIIQPIIIEKEVPVTKFVDRFIEKPYPEPVEVVREVNKPVVVPVPVEKVVEKPVEITRYVDKPYPVQIPQPYPVEVKVPYPVETKVFIDRPVHVPYQIEKVVEKQIFHPYPVPTPVAVPIEKKVLYPIPVGQPYPVPYEVEKRVPYETIVEKNVPVPYPIEKKVPYPVPYETKVAVPIPVEKRVPVPVPYEKIVEKPVTVTKYVEKPVPIEVPVPQPVPYAVHYPQPYPVDRIVEKKVPIQVPYPVEKVVEKIVEKPVVVTKYIDKPYPVETKVPYPVEKIVEKKVPYPVKVPYEVRVPYAVEKVVEKPIHVPYPVETLIPIPFRIPYSSQSNQKYTPEQHRQGIPPPHITQHRNFIPQYYQSQKSNEKQPIQSTHWGNLYASSYQYINNTKNHLNNAPLLTKYIDYITNSNNQYYGPPPMTSSKDSWAQNGKNFLVELKLRRTDRTPKNIRIEYGGFKPPLIPSTEVDLDGVPIKKENDL